MPACIFCKIADHTMSSDIVYEDKKVIVIKDIKPSAPIHLLIISKKHIKSAAHLTDTDTKLISHIILTGQKMALKQKITKTGYKLIFNVGRGGGQLIDHLHLHLIGGWK